MWEDSGNAIDHELKRGVSKALKSSVRGLTMGINGHMNITSGGRAHQAESLGVSRLRYLDVIKKLKRRQRKEVEARAPLNWQFSENLYLNCWQIFEGETLHMWGRYGKGVVVFSRLDLLRAELSRLLGRHIPGHREVQ